MPTIFTNYGGSMGVSSVHYLFTSNHKYVDANNSLRKKKPPSHLKLFTRSFVSQANNKGLLHRKYCFTGNEIYFKLQKFNIKCFFFLLYLQLTFNEADTLGPCLAIYYPESVNAVTVSVGPVSKLFMVGSSCWL